MIKSRIILLLFFFNFQLLYSQNSFFEKGLELFDDEQFILAQSYFEKINTDQALFYNAECSKILFLDDAEFLYEKLILDFPESQGPVLGWMEPVRISRGSIFRALVFGYLFGIFVSVFWLHFGSIFEVCS